MDESLDAPIQNLSENPVDESGTRRSTVSRRDLLRLTLCGGAGLALDGLLDVSAVRAATKDLKLSEVSEFTTVVGTGNDLLAGLCRNALQVPGSSPEGTTDRARAEESYEL